MSRPVNIFSNKFSFEEKLTSIFQYQVLSNPIYRNFVTVFGLSESSDITAEKIPLLPIRAFKQARLICDGCTPQIRFKSSGTGTMERSEHLLTDPDLYHQAITLEFYRHFPSEKYSIISYMPGYSENPDSSLLYMLDYLIKNDPDGFSFRLPLGKPLLSNQFKDIQNSGRNILLFGAAFGLLDLVEVHSDPLPEGSEIIETGGMKTHRRDMSKKELRGKISKGFNVPQKKIHSEYGMCELLSQCYAIGGEWFGTPDWVCVSIRKADDPGQVCEPGIEGKIGIIDLANMHSCPFILTEDRGVMNSKGEFKVLGRWRSNEMRGCNFLIDRE